MALDWKQEVSVDTIKNLFKKNKGTGPAGFPSKTSMNLFQGDAHTIELRNVVIVGVLLAAGITLFVKFGVVDQLSALSAKEGELAQAQALVQEASASSADYETIKKAYDAYKTQYGSNMIDAMQVLDLVETHVQTVANVPSVVFSNNTLTLSLGEMSLDAVGVLAKDLESQPMVSSVNVTTATTQNPTGQSISATMVVTLVQI